MHEGVFADDTRAGRRRSKASASAARPKASNVFARWPKARKVSGCSGPNVRFDASRRRRSKGSASAAWPKAFNVPARLPKTRKVSGCSVPTFAPTPRAGDAAKARSPLPQRAVRAEGRGSDPASVLEAPQLSPGLDVEDPGSFASVSTAARGLCPVAVAASPAPRGGCGDFPSAALGACSTFSCCPCCRLLLRRSRSVDLAVLRFRRLWWMEVPECRSGR